MSHQLGPVEERLSVITNERAALTREREETMATLRADIDSLKTKETNVRNRTANINR